MTLNDPFAYEFTTSSVVKIISINSDHITVKDPVSDKVRSYPLHSCQKYLQLPPIIKNNLYIFSRPLFAMSANTSELGYITNIEKNYISVSFKDTCYSSIRLPISACENNLLMPDEVYTLSSALRRMPKEPVQED